MRVPAGKWRLLVTPNTLRYGACPRNGVYLFTGRAIQFVLVLPRIHGAQSTADVQIVCAPTQFGISRFPGSSRIPRQRSVGISLLSMPRLLRT